jgi:hypothetical protein
MHEFDDLPDDLAELAHLGEQDADLAGRHCAMSKLAHIASHDPDAARRNAAFDKLVGEVQRIARHVACVVPRRLRDDCLNSAMMSCRLAPRRI